MNEFSLDDLDDDVGDFDAANSDNEKVDSILIKRILCEMKSEFNKATCNVSNEYLKVEEDEEIEEEQQQQPEQTQLQEPEIIEIKESSSPPAPIYIAEEVERNKKPEMYEDSINTEVENHESEFKEETDSSQAPSNSSASIVVNNEDIKEAIPKKPAVRRSRHSYSPAVDSLDESLGKRSTRRSSSRYNDSFEYDVSVKRSSRRMKRSRKSVLQNAIARKEKSLRSFNPPQEKPHRRSSRIIEEQKLVAATRKSMKTRSQSEYEMTNGNGELDENSIEEQRALARRKGFRGFDPLKKVQKLSKENEALEEEHHFKTRLSSVADHESEKENDSLCMHSSDTESKSKMEISLDSEIAEENATSKEKPIHSLSVPTGLCECESLTVMRPKKECLKMNDMCHALDSFDEKLYLCCNPVSSDTILLRPSKRTPYLQFCDAHVHRLFGHNACPLCGIFCTQGIFNVCINRHVFHKDCAISKEVISECPHCGTSDFSLYKFRMENHKYPLFLPTQKPINRERRARLSLQYNEQLYQSKTIEESILATDVLVLPNGNKITSSGIPMTEKEQLDSLLKESTFQNEVRYVYRNLYQASKNGDVEQILIMLANGMNPNREPGCMCALHAAAGAGHLLAVHVLIQAGANPNILDKSQYTALMVAALNNHNNVLKYLVKAGACLTEKGADGMTALHIASKLGNIEGCHILLSASNTLESFVNTVDDGRWTALVWAAENCHSTVVRYLLEKRADPHIRDGEMNIALHWSAFSGSMEITEDLLNYGSNINLSNAHGDTPLHIAARQGAQECVTMLLARGARPDMLNKAGLSPKDCVINRDSYCVSAIELNLKINHFKSSFQKFPRILSNDISRGREGKPIQCLNSVDNEELPINYTYITENCFTSNLTIDRTVTSLDPCKCDDMCYTSGCMCSKISQRCWYDNKGKLNGDFNFEDPPMLFECSEACNCNVLICKNRVVQKGIKVSLQMIKTAEKSWGVISLATIPKGTYVCEYVGEIISDCEADTREDDSYLFDLDNREGGESYCLDACKYGNITRFINHSCRPNLAPVRIFIGHRDLHFPRIAMFATRDIKAHEELGFDYGEKFWVIKGKSFTCQCKEEVCRYSDQTIHQTLEKFNENMEMEEALA